ncbi:unnamed protein product [Kluyveromyces dobzhanskii CBS 2104]|uniref:WGS project CCBQ000000000 data, contig 00058 n=1 Tax=Kluyveromyces dobzhanskii CBS 2104 TaxID=1427455 RepID=A0A0A8LC11_9SACH|nr:unnamed protein product [Kluyveromyces dobzhanskii CBS 2104]
MLTVKNVQRAGTPGICVRSDSESDLSSRFNFSPDDVDIEDGYNSDSNNGLHLFNLSSSWNCTAAASNNGRPYQSAYTNPTIPPLVQVQQPSNLYLSSRTSNIPLHSSSSPNDMSEMLEQNAQNMLIQSGGTQLDVEKMEHVPEKDVAGVKHKFQSEMYAHFKIKRDQIRRQLKSIFIYPLAYLILWVFPFVVDCSQYSHEVYHGPIVWLAYIATFMQPLNGVVDVAVFMFREQPWRYSWASIHSKELINRYKLKGEIGETDITNMCESDWGRRGWYYRGRWRKEECWKHQPQCWKRICWYTGRFLVGLWKNKFIYEDNCMDRNYWDAYYGKQTSKTFSLSTTNKMTPISHQSLTPSSGSSDNGLDAYKNKVEVKFLWRVIHLLPLQEGIDLDELDRYLKFKNKYDDFVIPGLQLAIEQNISTNNNTLFKPDYSLSGHKGEKDSTNDNSHSRHSTPLETPIMKTFDLGDISNMNFADVTANPNLPGISANAGRSENSKEEQLDLLSFLKGEPQP